MSFYPDKISKHFYAPKYAGKAERTNAVGAGASFVCGALIRVFLEIDVETKEIREAKFATNGCGFAAAAADVLMGKIAGQKLTELHGAKNNELQKKIESELGGFGEHRKHCLEISLESFDQALADFRAYQLEEFAGEKALICTCFGVSEETIEQVISENQAATVEEVGEFCQAGTGCGSCQFLIQELIDVFGREN